MTRDERSRLEYILSRLERDLAWDDAVHLAVFERSGVELEPGGAFTEADAKRADEIFELCFRPRGAEAE